jgi:hypothetical protein
LQGIFCYKQALFDIDVGDFLVFFEKLDVALMQAFIPAFFFGECIPIGFVTVEVNITYRSVFEYVLAEFG